MPLRKFYLKINGASITNVEDLRAHFARTDVLGYYRDGRLRRWLSFFPEDADLAAALDALDPSLAEDALWAALCGLFEAEEAAPPPAPAPAPAAERDADEPPRITAALRWDLLTQDVNGYHALLEKMTGDIGDWEALVEDAYRIERDYLPLFAMTSPRVFEMFKNTKALLAIVQCEGLWAVWRGIPEIEQCFWGQSGIALLGLKPYDPYKRTAGIEYETTPVHQHGHSMDESDPRWERVQKHISSPDSFVNVGEIFVLGFDSLSGTPAMRSADEPDTVYKRQDCRFVRLREPEFSGAGRYPGAEWTLAYFPVENGELQFRNAEVPRNFPDITAERRAKAEAKAKLDALFLSAAAESNADGAPQLTAALRRDVLAESAAGYRALLEKMADDINDWKELLADAELLEQDYLPLFTITSPAVFETFKFTRALLAIVQREGLWAVWRRMPEINDSLSDGVITSLLGLPMHYDSRQEYETAVVHRRTRFPNEAPRWERVQKRVYSPSSMVDVGEIFVLGVFDHLSVSVFGYSFDNVAMRSADAPDTVYKDQDCRLVRLREPEFSAYGREKELTLAYLPVVDGELQLNDTDDTHDERWKEEAKAKLKVLFL